MFIDDAVDKLLSASMAAGLSEATVVSYRKHLVPLRHFLGRVDVNSVSTDDLREYVIHLQTRSQQYADHRYRRPVNKPLSRYTINSHLRACRRLLNFLYQEGVIVANPAARLTISKPPDRQVKAISDQGLQAMLAVAVGKHPQDLRDRAVLLCLADTGCRRGGLAGLRLLDLHLGQRSARVSEKGTRTRKIFFGPTTAQALEKWLAVRPVCDHEEVFVTLTNDVIKPLGPEGISRVCKRLKRTAGIKEPASPHAFRHRFAREFLRQGGDIGVLSQLMGHADINVTLKHYAQFIPDELQAFHRQYSSLSDLLQNDEETANGIERELA